ncbi:periaxin isoform X2 [Eublepharis macularius]|nr:periaxin isoform X2 [Eublepharis macularius]XP_054855025.1 periaxin isoform X2 [Eublepharis macularius]XP_054855026.1 periaxin isoform X2 [Eublepharis macularius]
MEAHLRAMEKTIEASELLEVIVETEAEAGVSGMSVAGGGKEGIFVKDVLEGSPAAQAWSLREGDQLLSARVYFDNMKYEDALQILRSAEPYKISFCLKRTVPSTDVRRSPGAPTFEVRGPKAKMAKLSIQSLTSLKKKAAGKSVAQRLGEAKGWSPQEPVGSKQEGPPVDVEFSLPLFSKLRRAKSTGEVAVARPSPERSPLLSSLESKRRKLKLPRLRVREALAARAGGVEGRLDRVLPKTATEQKAAAREGIGGKVSKLTAPFSRGKKPKEEGGAKGEAGVQVPQVELDLSLPTVGPSGESPKAGAKHEGFPVQVLPLGLPKVEMALPTGSPVGLEAPEESFPARLKLPTAEVAVPKVEVGLHLPKLEGTAPETTLKGEGFQFKVPKVGVSTEETERKLAPLGFVLGKGKDRASRQEEKVAVPSLDVRLPSVDLEIPLPRRKPETETPKPKMEVPDVSIKVPTLGLPKLGSKLQEEEESRMPQVELCVGKPESPKAKAKSPRSQARGFGIALMEGKSESKEAPVGPADSKMKSPGLTVPSLDVQLPKALVGLAAPAPGAKAEEAVEGPRFKIQMPHLSLPRGSFPSKAMPSPPQTPAQVPKPEGSAGVPALDLSLPAAKWVEVPLPKGHVPKPELDLSVGRPQVEVALPVARLSFPSARAPALELDMPKVGIELDLPKADSECWAPDQPSRDQEVTLKMPSLETLSKDLEVEISVPRCRGDQPDLEPGLGAAEGPEVGAIIARIPKVALALGKEQAAEVSLVSKEGAGLEGLVTGGQVKLPSVEVSAIKFPEVTRERGKSHEMEGRAKSQKFALPKFSISGPKVWKASAEPFVAQVESPEAADKGSKLKMLKFGVSFPKSKWGGEVEGPRPAEGGKGGTPKERARAAATGAEPPESKVKLPSVALPQVDVHIGLPTGKAETACEGDPSPRPALGIELPDLKQKMPKFSLPKFGSKSKESDVELETGEAKPSRSREGLAGARGAKSSGKEAGAKAPKSKRSLFSTARRDPEGLSPAADSKTKKGPESPKEKPRGPSVKMPSPMAGAGQARIPQVELPKIGLPVAKAEEALLVGSESPGLQVRVPLLEIAMPGATTKGETALGEASGAAIKSHEGELTIPKAPCLGISAPIVELDLSLPTAGAEAPVPQGATGADAKIKLPQVELPKFGSGEGADVCLLGRGEEQETAGTSTLGSKIQLPKVGITLPKTQLPGVELHQTEGEGAPAGPGGVFKMPSVGLPKFSTPKGKASEQEPAGSLEASRMLPTVPLSSPSVRLPKSRASSSGGEGEAETGLPQLELKVPRLIGSTEMMLGTETGSKGGPVKVPPPLTSFGLCKADGEVEAGAMGEVAACGPPDSKFKLKIPSLGLSKAGMEPRTDTQPLCPSPKEGDVSFQMPQIALPAVGFSVDQDGKREAKVEAGKRASAEGLEVEGFEGRLKMPKIKIPALGMSVPKGSQGTAAPQSPGSSGLEGDPDGKKATFMVPGIELSTPTLKAHAEYEVEGAQLWHGGSQELEVAGRRAQAGSDGHKSPGGKGEASDTAAGKKYKVKIPKFGLSLPKAGESVPGQDAEAKVKRPIFVLARPKGKGAEGASGLLEGDEETDSKGAGGKFKLRPTVGLSLSELKMGAEVNGELEDGGPGKGSSGMKLPKVGFSKAEGAQVHGERAEDSLQNGSRGKLGKLRLPQLGLSSPSALAGNDPELSLQLVRTDAATEDGASGGPGGAFAALKFKPPKITFSGFKKNGEAAPGPVVSSAARTEMASLERGEGAKGEKSPKFKFPKLALSPKPHGVLEITSKGQASPEKARRGAPEGLNVQLPRVGFSEEAADPLRVVAKAEGEATAAV